MKTTKRKLLTISAVFGTLALGLIGAFMSLMSVGTVPVPPVTYALGDLSLQNGWDGGSAGVAGSRTITPTATS